MVNIILIGLKTKELLRQNCSYHGNLVTMATKYVANAYYPKETLYQNGLNITKVK